MPSRSTTTLKAKLECKLLAYAAAAGAAGLEMITMAIPANAEVIYTPAHHVISKGHSYDLDVDGNGTIDFQLRNFSWSDDTIGGYRLRAKPHKDNGLTGYATNFTWASALKSNARIGSKKVFVDQKPLLVSFYFNGDGSGTYGQWLNVKKHYLGLRFRIHGEIHYGWARLNVAVVLNQITGKLTGYAYETIPDKPIVAGDEGAGAKSLGHLALGEAGKKR